MGAVPSERGVKPAVESKSRRLKNIFKVIEPANTVAAKSTLSRVQYRFRLVIAGHAIGGEY